MKCIFSVVGVISMLAGAYFDLKALSYHGSFLFIVSLFLIAIGIGLNFQNYLAFIRQRSEIGKSNGLVFLLRNFGKIIVMFFFAINILALVISILYKSSDAFETAISEIEKSKNKDFKLGLIVTGKISKYFDGDIQGKA